MKNNIFIFLFLWLFFACLPEKENGKEQVIHFHCDTSKYKNSLRYKPNINFCYKSQNLWLKNHYYTFIRMGMVNCDSIGYFRREGNRIYFLDYDPFEHHPDENEQILMDFSLQKGDTLGFKPTALWGFRNVFLIEDINYATSGERVATLRRIDSLSRIVVESCNVCKMTIGEKRGFIELLYCCYGSGMLRYYPDSLTLDSIAPITDYTPVP